MRRDFAGLLSDPAPIESLNPPLPLLGRFIGVVYRYPVAVNQRPEAHVNGAAIGWDVGNSKGVHGDIIRAVDVWKTWCVADIKDVGSRAAGAPGKSHS